MGVALHDETGEEINAGTLVTDDNPTLRRHCKLMKNGEKLKDRVCEPKFLADPSHRIKVMVKHIFSLVTNILHTQGRLSCPQSSLLSDHTMVLTYIR